MSASSHARRYRRLLWLLAAGLPVLLTPPIRAGSLSTVTPASASVGVSITILGTGFDPTAANNEVAFLTSTGVVVVATPSSAAVVDPRSGLRRLVVIVPAGLPVGTTPLRVTNKVTGEVSEGKALEVVAFQLPAVSAGAPGDSNLVVTIAGSPNTRFAGPVRAAFGPGVTVNSVSMQSPTQLVANITIAATAAEGVRDVNLLSGTLMAVAPAAFRIAVPVVNGPPAARVTGPTMGIVGAPLTFDAGTSSDPDGDPLAFAWGFGDGSPVRTTGPQVSHTFEAAGDYTVTVTASDGRGASHAASLVVHIDPANVAPLVSAGPDQTVTLPAAASLVGSVTDDGLPQGALVVSAWSKVTGPGTVTFADPASGQTTATFSQPGEYVLRLTGSDSALTALDELKVIVARGNAPPVAHAGGPYAGIVGQAVAFSGAGSTDPDGDPLSYSWSFGDDTTATGVSPSHSYALATTYTVTLTVNDGHGGESVATASVVISDPPPPNRIPSAHPGGPYSGLTGQSIAFDGTQSSDPDTDPLTYAWAFGDGTTATGPSPSHGYASPGTYTATLTVSDGRGGESTATVSVSISNPPLQNRIPSARPGGPYSGVTGQSISFDGTGSSDPDEDPLTYAWAFGDGTTATGPSPAHAFATADEFTVTLTVSDGRGGLHSSTVIVSIAQANRRPVAAAGGPYAGDAGSALVLSSAGSGDADGDALTYAWDFGDGNTGSGPSPAHVFAAAGRFTVTLTVNDGRGGTSQATAEATIGPAADRAPPNVVVSAPKEALPGAQVLVTAAASDNVAVTSVAFTVDGGTPSETTQPPYQRTVDIPALAAPGTKVPVKATARDAAGNSGSHEAAITIVAAPDSTPPTISLALPPEAAPGSTVRLTARADDSGGVRSVAFSTAGATFATDPVAPYEASFVIPAGTAPGTALTFVARAIDFADNQASATGEIAIVATPDTTPPVISLDSPAEVREGSLVPLSATATDNVRVASVTFFVDGVPIATIVDPPYRADFIVPSTRPAGSVFQVRAVAIDTSSLQTGAASDIRVASAATGGSGLISGEVYDDTTSLPLSGAQVAFIPAGSTIPTVIATTDARGQYFVSAPSGRTVVQIAKDGWTRIDRIVIVSDGRVAEAFDARLTPLAVEPIAVSAVVGGTVSRDGGTLSIGAGALAADASIRLARVSPQGLQGLLPHGWSPVGTVDLLPHGVTFNSPQPVALANSSARATPLVFAQWDETAFAWRALSHTSVSETTSLMATVSSTGQYAWLVADSLPAPPPAPVDGSVIAGAAPVAIPESATATVDPQPRVLFYTPGVSSRVGGTLDVDVALPSGTALRSRIAESYRFTDGASIQPQPFTQDFVFYQHGPLGAAQQQSGAAPEVSAAFVVTPSLTFDPERLQQGVITVDLRAPGVTAPAHVTTGGGTATTSTGERLTLAPASFSGPAPVHIERLVGSELGIALPPELAFIGGASVGFDGAPLQVPALLTIPRRVGVDDSGVLLLLRLVELEGATQLLLVGRGRVDGTRIVSESLLPDAPVALPGVSGAGRYLFARVTLGTGFVTGVVRGISDQPHPGALVSVSGWPTVSLSAGNGVYLTLAKVGGASLAARDPTTLDGATAEANVAAGAIAARDLRLAARAPAVSSVMPADGSTNVALAAAIVATFSEPIDPASVSGPGSGSITVTAPDGTVVAGALSLSGGNTRATFRPSTLLAPNTVYTVAVAGGFRNFGGRTLAAPVVASFTSLDTTPPPPPPAGSISATMPDASGVTTVTASQGSAGVHDTVAIINLTRNTSFPALVQPNGAFSATLAARVGDRLQVAITDPHGNQTVVPLPRFTRQNEDGSIATVVGAEGGRIDGPNGSAVDVPAGALPDGTVVTIGYLDEAAFPIKLTAAQKESFEFTGGVLLDFGGATPSAYVNVSLPAGANDTRDDRWIVGQAMTLAGRQVFNVADTARVIGGRIMTSSPPCPGVQAAAAYGFVKTAKRHVGLAVGYGRFAGSLSPDPFNTSILSWTQPALGVSSPFGVVATPGPMDVCMPILSGRVTVSPNSQQIVIAANQLTPADREIVVRNERLARTFHFPRHVAEFRFLVSGTTSDDYRVSIVTADGEQEVTPEISQALPGFVNVRLDMDTLTSVVTEVVVRNISKNPVIESRFRQSDAALKIPASGGAQDGFRVSAVNVDGVQRAVAFTVESPAGGGNLVAKALPVTIDPGTDVFLERYHGSSRVGRHQIPPEQIQLGGFTHVFEGDADRDVYKVVVEYHDGRPEDFILIPNVAFTVSDSATGRVIRTFNALVPPPDEPFNLGSVSGDTSWPILTATPTFLNNFDPSSPLSFTFSEGITRDSALNHFRVFDDQRRLVDGEIRLSNENRTLTFVPDAPLAMGARYTIEMELLEDASGNFMGTTVLNVTTFSPKAVRPPFTADGQLAGFISLTLYDRVDGDGTLQTIGVGITRTQTQATDSIVLLDITNPSAPVVLRSLPVGEGLERVHVISDVEGLATFGENPCGGGRTFSGDLLIVSHYRVNFSSGLLFYDITNPAQPCRLGTKALTLNPGLEVVGDGAADGGIVYTTLGFARNVVALRNGSRWTAYVAVENVGVMLADVGHWIAPLEARPDRLREQMIAGNYTDVIATGNMLLALERTNPSLDLLDRNLAMLSSTSLPLREAITLEYAEAIAFDADGNGQIGQDEIRNLAFVGGAGGIVIVDLTEIGSPTVVGTIPMTSAIFELEFDGLKRRLFAYERALPGDGSSALLLVDLSAVDPFRVLDRDQNGEDDRILWRTPPGHYQYGHYHAMLVDDESRVLYVGTRLTGEGVGGFDIWALDNRCCDLGVDFAAPQSSRAGGTPELLLREKKALQTALAAGLAKAVACGPVIRPAGAPFSTDSISIIEQGSGACLWKPNPTAACESTYQPGLSDHDFEVFIPEVFFGPEVPGEEAQCVLEKLGREFTNDDGTPKAIPVDGVTVTFPDITFYPVRREGFEAAKLDVLPPKGSVGGDPGGDLGLGRQQLLLKWLLEGEYIDVPGYDVKGKSLDSILARLWSTTNIPALEGHEWGVLQRFALAKSKALLRIKGASTAGSSLHELYVAQLHDAGKAGIRAALARMVADEPTYEVMADTTRAEYASSACRNISAETPPEEWNPKPCTGFEEFVASVAARSLSLPAPIFTPSDVSDVIHWFYQVKAGLTTPDEATADVFIRTAANFIDSVIAATKDVYDQDIINDPDAAQRTDNLAFARQQTEAKLTATSLHITPRVFNHGFVEAPGTQVSMFRGSDGPGAHVISTRVTLGEAEERYLDSGPTLSPESQDGLTPEDRGLLDLTSVDPSYKESLFVLGDGSANNPAIDLRSGTGIAEYVAFTIDLPEKKAKEANRLNNYNGFWFYVLDLNAEAEPPPTPDRVPLPVDDLGGELLKPDIECVPQGDLTISQGIVLPGVPEEQTGPVAIDLNAVVTYNIHLRNDSGKTLNDVVVCTSIVTSGDNCTPVGTLLPDEDKTISIPWTAPATPQVIDAVASARTPDLGVRQSAVMRLLCGCEPEVIVALEHDPNPIDDENGSPADATVMRGGTALRYFRVVDRRSGVPVVGAGVHVTIEGPEGTNTVTITTDEHGRIASEGEEGLAILAAAALEEGDELVVTMKVASALPFCAGEQQFIIGVEDRSFRKIWNGGGAIGAEGSIEVGLQGKLGAGLSLAITEKAGKGRQTLGLTRMNSWQAGVIETLFETGFSDQTGPIKTEAIISAKAGATNQLQSSDLHELPFAAGSQSLGEEESAALGGLLLTAFGGQGGPIPRKLLDTVADQLASVGGFKIAEVNALSLEGSAKPKASIAAGFAVSKESAEVGGVDFGLEAGAGASASIGFQLSVEDRIKANELTPAYELKGSLDLGGSLGVTSGEPKEAQKQSLVDKLRIALTLGFAGSIKGSLTLDESTLAVKRLVLALSGTKKFGWQVFANSYQTPPANAASKWTIRFTITDKELIDQFIATLTSFSGLTLKGLVGEGRPTLGLSAASTEIAAFIDAVVNSDGIRYEIVEEKGEGVLLPLFSKKIALVGLTVGASASLNFDRIISFTTEKGVIRGGELFALVKYTDDELIPELPQGVDANVDEFVQLAEIGYAALGDFASSAFDAVTSPFDRALDRVIRSNNTAEIAYRAASEPVFSPAVLSFTYTPLPQSFAKPFLMRPASTAGPASAPHYGIGGFHQFLPDDKVFTGPATVTVFYEEGEVQGIDETTLGVYRWNEAREDWDFLGGVVDAQANTVTVPVDRMGLYTAAPPMPAGVIELTPAWTPAGNQTDPRTIVTYTSSTLRLNSGQQVADGTLYTVFGAAASSAAVPVGTVTTADADPTTPGVQVSAQNGVIQFTVDYPGSTGAVLPIAASREGTAFAAAPQPLRP